MAEAENHQPERCSHDTEGDRASLDGSMGSGTGSSGNQCRPISNTAVGNQSGIVSTERSDEVLIKDGWTENDITAVQQATGLSTWAILNAWIAGLTGDQMVAAVEGNDRSSLAILINSGSTSGTPADKAWTNDAYLVPQEQQVGPVVQKDAAPIVTMGKILSCDVAIEQISGDQLLLWDGDKLEKGSTVRFEDQTYAAAKLHRSLAEALYLPDCIHAFGGIQKLFTKLCDVFSEHGTEKGISPRLAGATLGTWVSKCLPGPLIINLIGPPGAETTVLGLLMCVCRRALKLADPSMHHLASLPAGCNPTLVLDRPSERTLKQLVAAAGNPGMYFLSRGRLFDLRWPIIVCTRTPVSVPAVRVPLLPVNGLRRLTNMNAELIADFFQPKLLWYRLMQHQSVADSQFDAPREFCPEARTVGRVLGAAVEGAPDIQVSIMESLRSDDLQHKSQQSQAPAAGVVEVLLTLCHNKEAVTTVGQIALFANNLLKVRQENMELSPRAVGDVLRQELGLSPRRRSHGYELGLDLGSKRRVHHLASDYGVLEPVVDCALCQEVSGQAPPSGA